MKTALDVAAYNLSTLHDSMRKFTTLTNQEFILRMGSHEAAVFGQRALELLSRARSNLCAKYGLELKQQTIVEVFPEQKDFAIRTFGLPGNPGYLGVCFGNVITANGPARSGTGRGSAPRAGPTRPRPIRAARIRAPRSLAAVAPAVFARAPPMASPRRSSRPWLHVLRAPVASPP